VDETLRDETEAIVTKAVSVGKSPTGGYENLAIDGEVFSTTASLAAGASFSSDMMIINGYSQLQVNALADTDGVITGQWYSDFAGTDLLRTFNRPYSGGEGYALLSSPTFAPYLKMSYTNGSATQSDFYYATKFLTKSISGQILGIDETIPPNVVANMTRTITTGRQPDGDYVNTPADGTAFSTSATMSAGATFSSDWIDTDGFRTIEVFISSDQESSLNGIQIQFTDDAIGTASVVRSSISYTFNDVNVLNGSIKIKQPVALDGFRIVYNNGPIDQTEFLCVCDLRTTLSEPPYQQLESNIDVNQIVPVSRNILVGREPSGNFENVSVTQTSNDAGTYNNLNVVSGARPSQISGRVQTIVSMDSVTADSLLYTVTSGKTLYVTDALVTVDNSANILGKFYIRDGTTVAGTIVVPLLVSDPGNGGDSVTIVIQMSFNEPIAFSTGVYFDEVAGTLTMSGVFSGYEE
jgi:hypothetical protein